MKKMMQTAFNPIHADQDLIDTTLRNVSSPSGVATQKARSKFSFRRSLAIVTAVVLMSGVFAIAGTAIYSTPVAAVSVDINPSIELEINVLHRVVSAEAYNEEGALILAKLDLINLPVKAAVSQIVEAAAEAGYVEEDGSSIIAITTSTDNDSLGDDLEEETEDAVQDALDDTDSEAVVYHDNTGLALVAEARLIGITPGRLNLIYKLIALDPTKTVEEYKDAKASDIMKEVVSLQQAQHDIDKGIEESVRESEKADSQSQKESLKGDQDADESTGESSDETDPVGDEDTLTDKQIEKMAKALEKSQNNKENHGKGKK
jgi:hypothetical protein